MRASELVGLPIVTRDGHHVGHLVDVRFEEGDDGAPVVAVMRGTIGWLERLGLRAAHARPLAWARVSEMGPDGIVVELDRAERSHRRA